YASDVSSINRLLNQFTLILGANGQHTAKIFIPQSIQRIKDTEMVAFVKRVDLEIPENRITEALMKVGLDAISVTRLNRKEAKPTTTTNTNKTPTQSSITTNDSIKKLTPKPKPTAKTSKRNRSLDSSLDSTIMDTKDRKGVGMGARAGMSVFT
ncbi:unnamed protein product, partial [Rotaria magnacalcarata]